MSARVEKAPLDGRLMGRVPGEDMPTFCPVCGRTLVYLWWDTVGGDMRYHLLACYGDMPKWQVRFRLRFLMESPFYSHAHYRYEWGPTDNALPEAYDRHTGEPLGGDR